MSGFPTTAWSVVLRARSASDSDAREALGSLCADSRTDSHLRDDLYALLGFKTVDGFEYPAELEDRRLSNPDAFQYLDTLTVQSGSESVEVMPVIQSLLPLNEVIQLPNFFDALDIVLLSAARDDMRRHHR